MLEFYVESNSRYYKTRIVPCAAMAKASPRRGRTCNAKSTGMRREQFVTTFRRHDRTILMTTACKQVICYPPYLFFLIFYLSFYRSLSLFCYFFLSFSPLSPSRYLQLYMLVRVHVSVAMSVFSKFHFSSLTPYHTMHAIIV